MCDSGEDIPAHGFWTRGDRFALTEVLSVLGEFGVAAAVAAAITELTSSLGGLRSYCLCLRYINDLLSLSSAW